MKFRNLLTIVFILSGLHLFFWWLYAEVLTREGLQRKKAALFSNQKNRQASIWIMGDSHPMMALNPDYLPGSFNFGATSEYYFLSLQKLKRLLSENRPPGILILPLDLHSFSAQGNALLLQHELDDVYWSQQTDPFELMDAGLPSSWMRWYLSARFFPYAGQYYRLLASMKKEDYQVENNGFVPADAGFSKLSNTEKQQTAEARFRAHFDKFPAMDSLQVAALSGIAEICKNNNVRLLLLSYPVSDEYLRCAENKRGLEKVKHLADSVKGRHLHADFSRFFSGKPDCFSDPDHLNPFGAQLLSRHLKQTLDSLMKIPVSVPKGI